MRNTTDSQVDSPAGSQEPASRSAGLFARRFAVSVAAIFSVFVTTLMLLNSDVARFALIWALWAAVIVVAGGTYWVGRFVGRRSSGAHWPPSQQTSPQTRGLLQTARH
ncbi:MAG: hypothetical protein ACC654_05990 [Acidimicrobiia bacterium]